MDELSQIKVKYEFFDERNEQQFSEEYKLEISLAPENFEDIPTLISNLCNYKTKEERIYYKMFDLNRELFIINSEQLSNYLKKGEVIIMKNCRSFVQHIIKLLKEGETIIDIEKKNIMKKVIFNLKTNYLCVDMFSEDFISYEGIKYLISFIQNTVGNIRIYALEALYKILEYNSAIDYIRKRDEYIDILYEIFIKSDSELHYFYSLISIIKAIFNDEKKIFYLIETVEKYSEKSHTKICSMIIKIFNESKDISLKKATLFFVNLIIDFCESNNIQKRLFSEEEMWRLLEKSVDIKDKDFQDQLTNYQIKTKNIIINSDYELKLCSKYFKKRNNNLMKYINY